MSKLVIAEKNKHNRNNGLYFITENKRSFNKRDITVFEQRNIKFNHLCVKKREKKKQSSTYDKTSNSKDSKIFSRKVPLENIHNAANVRNANFLTLIVCIVVYLTI